MKLRGTIIMPILQIRRLKSIAPYFWFKQLLLWSIIFLNKIGNKRQRNLSAEDHFLQLWHHLSCILFSSPGLQVSLFVPLTLQWPWHLKQISSPSQACRTNTDPLKCWILSSSTSEPPAIFTSSQSSFLGPHLEPYHQKLFCLQKY